jgi:hypothetical protein
VNPVIGRVGAPYLVVYEGESGNLSIQLFQNPEPIVKSDITDDKTESNSSKRLSSARYGTRSIGRSSIASVTSGASPPSHPPDPNPSSTAARAHRRVIKAAAYMAPDSVPSDPGIPTLADQRPDSITIEVGEVERP